MSDPTHPKTQSILERRFYGLTNRKRKINTLEVKANITGYMWIVPQDFDADFRERRNKREQFICYERTSLTHIKDVDGINKQTIKTEYFHSDKRTRIKQDAIGVWKNGLAGSYHGRNSCNWKLERLTLQEIIDLLNAGFAFAPGYYAADNGKSLRTAEACQYRDIILPDIDEWTSEHPAPQTFDELIDRYPYLSTDFYWIGESISSRSSLKPEMRFRGMLVLPEGISDPYEWEATIDHLVSQYPFIARGVGMDKVRLSFGNARPECENRILGGHWSDEQTELCRKIAVEKKTSETHIKQQREEQAAANQERRAKDIALEETLKQKGIPVNSSGQSPIEAFCNIPVPVLLDTYGLATDLGNGVWNWNGATPGRSFEEKDGTLLIYSQTMQSFSPETDPTTPVNGHRFIANLIYDIDMTSTDNRKLHQLRCKLAEAGYGTHPDEYRKMKRDIKTIAVREGIMNPLSLRPAANPLPVDKDKLSKVLSTLEQNQEVIKNAFGIDIRVVGLYGGPGEGKTNSAISYAVDGNILTMALNTTDLAQQVCNRFNTAECITHLWKSRFYGYSGKDDYPQSERIADFKAGRALCIKPEHCEASRIYGIPPRLSVCPSCQMFADCQEYAYLSQAEQARQVQVQLIAMPQLFLDPAHAAFLSGLDTTERLHIIDEAKAHELFLQCSLTKEMLQTWVKHWQDTELGTIASRILQILEVACKHPYKVVEYIRDLTDEQVKRISKSTTRYRVSYTRALQGAIDKDTDRELAYHTVLLDNDIWAYVATDTDAFEVLREKGEPVIPPQVIEANGYLELTPAQTLFLGIVNVNDWTSLEELGSVYESQHWTPFQQLRIFSDRYKRAEDAPISYQNGILSWVIPPQLAKQVKQLIVMGGSLDKDGFERAFGHTEHLFIETTHTPYVEGANTFQIRTGAYPRRSLLEYVKRDDKWTVVELSQTGRHFFNSIATEMERDRQVKHIIITFKSIVDMLGDDLSANHQNLMDIRHFHNMEGLDYEDDGFVFWIVGCPEVPHSTIVYRAKMLHGNDETPLCFDRDEEPREYTDTRVQHVWETEVVARLNQAIGRGRLIRRANTVMVFTNIPIHGFTARATGFVIEDLEVAAGLSNLKTIADARQEEERKKKEQSNNSDRDKDQSQREQERDEKRKSKQEQKDKVLELYYAEVQIDDIVKRTGVSRRTIYNWIDQLRF